MKIVWIGWSQKLIKLAIAHLLQQLYLVLNRSIQHWHQRSNMGHDHNLDLSIYQFWETRQKNSKTPQRLQKCDVGVVSQSWNICAHCIWKTASNWNSYFQKQSIWSFFKGVRGPVAVWQWWQLTHQQVKLFVVGSPRHPTHLYPLPRDLKHHMKCAQKSGGLRSVLSGNLQMFQVSPELMY